MLNDFTLQLSEHLTQTVNGAVRVAVQEKVNGKIDDMKSQLNTYIKSDMDWKKEIIQPVVDAFGNLNTGKRLLMGGVKWVALLGGAVVAVSGAWVVIKAFLSSQLIK